MKRMFGKNRKETSEGKKDESKANPPRTQESLKGRGGRQLNAETRQQPQKAAKSTNVKTGGKGTQNSQSALLPPGNNSGLQNKKENSLIQFGPILKEFLGSKELVNKSLNIEYTQTVEKFEVTLTFQEVLPNGVSTAPKRSLPLEVYLTERANLLKKKDPASSFKGFVSILLDRVGIDLTRAKPNVEFKSIERFVLKHLSPIERELVKLKPDEYDRVDSRKIPEMMSPTFQVINDHYGSFEERTEFLLSQINSDNPTPDMEPPNWVLKGVPGLSKSALLEALKLTHVPKITAEQQQLIDALSNQLFDGEEEKSDDGPSKPSADTNAAKTKNVDNALL